MPAILQDDADRLQGTRHRLGGREGNGILPPVDDERGKMQPLQGREQIVVAERGPDGLLDAAGDAEGREVSRAARIGEVAGDAQLEGALPIRLRVALAEIGGAQLVTQGADPRSRLPAREPALELLG